MTDIETRVALLEQALADAKHRARNDRQIAMGVQEELWVIGQELATLRARLYAAVAVAMALGPAFAWMFERI